MDVRVLLSDPSAMPNARSGSSPFNREMNPETKPIVPGSSGGGPPSTEDTQRWEYVGQSSNPTPAHDAENRGVKRKLAGWTAPVDMVQTVIQRERFPSAEAAVLKPESLDAKPTSSEPSPPIVRVKSEASVQSASPDIISPPHRPLSHYARMGSRLPGSGDLGGTETKERVWPCLPGVEVGVKRKTGEGVAESGLEALPRNSEEEEVVLEEECYSWTDLPMNKQGKSSCPCPKPLYTHPSLSRLLGFRYIPCGPSPIPSPSPSHPFYRRVPALRAPFGMSEDAAFDSPESIQSSAVHLDWLDRSLYLKISPSAMTCTAEKGFRSVRGNVPVRHGAWYFECLILKGGGEGKSAVAAVNGETSTKEKRTGPVSERLGSGPGKHSSSNGIIDSSVTPLPQHSRNASNSLGIQNPSTTSAASSSSSDGAHVRIGWGRREAPLNGPCGLDAYSYGIRDATGEKVTLSRPKAYADLGGKGGFGTGDVVGCLISLPESTAEEEEQSTDRNVKNRDQPRKVSNNKDEYDPSWIKRKRIPIRYKGQLYFESMEYTVSKEMEALVARDGRAVIPPVEVNGASGAMAGEPAGRDGYPAKGRSGASPMKGKGGGNSKSKGKQAGKAVRKKATGARRKRMDDGDDSDDENRIPKPRVIPRLQGSKISFFLNGKPMASTPAFEDIFDFLPLRQTDAEIASKDALIKRLGALEASLRDRDNPNDDGTLGYYPFISCFGGGKVRFHPGPNWMAPVDPMSWNLGFKLGRDGFQEPIIPRPLVERWQEFRGEETSYDRADEDELTELLRKERAAEAAKNRVKTGGGSKPSKNSAGKKGSMTAALQASTPVSRASSTVPSITGSAPASVSRPSAFLATMIQDRGTPGGTPAPDTPVQAQFVETRTEYAPSSPPKTAGSSSSFGLGPVQPAAEPLNPYPVYHREQTVSATSEDAVGEDDWSDQMAEDAPELPYGMELTPSLACGTGQIQETGEAGHQPE